jgi:hypothetical protein
MQQGDVIVGVGSSSLDSTMSYVPLNPQMHALIIFLLSQIRQLPQPDKKRLQKSGRGF